MSMMAYQPFGFWPWGHYDAELQHLQRDLGSVDESKDGAFKYTCNVHGFKPDEIEVHEEGHTLVVQAHQKHNGPNEHCERTMKRIVRLPTDVHVESVRCEMNEKGELCICAEKKAINAPVKRPIQVTYKPAIQQQKK